MGEKDPLECSTCQKGFNTRDRVIEALRDHWFHATCWKCSVCDQGLPMTGDFKFQFHHGELFCVDCAEGCEVCSQPVLGQVELINGKIAHHNCCSCAHCGLEIDPQAHFMLDEHIICDECKGSMFHRLDVVRNVYKHRKEDENHSSDQLMARLEEALFATQEMNALYLRAMEDVDRCKERLMAEQEKRHRAEFAFSRLKEEFHKLQDQLIAAKAEQSSAKSHAMDPGTNAMQKSSETTTGMSPVPLAITENETEKFVGSEKSNLLEAKSTGDLPVPLERLELSPSLPSLFAVDAGTCAGAFERIVDTSHPKLNNTAFNGSAESLRSNLGLQSTSRHNFKVQNYLKPTRCEMCEVIVFGVELKCQECGMKTHARCAQKTVKTICQKGGIKTASLTSPAPTLQADASNISSLITAIEKQGAAVEGIYSKSGSSSQAAKIVQQLIKEEKSQLSKSNSLTLAHALKLYLKQMREPVIDKDDYAKLRSLRDIREIPKKIPKLRDIVLQMNPTKKQILQNIVQHVVKTAEYSSSTKMTLEHLTSAFAPVLVISYDLVKEGSTASLSEWSEADKCNVVSLFIAFRKDVF